MGITLLESFFKNVKISLLKVFWEVEHIYLAFQIFFRILILYLKNKVYEKRNT